MIQRTIVSEIGGGFINLEANLDQDIEFEYFESSGVSPRPRLQKYRSNLTVRQCSSISITDTREQSEKPSATEIVMQSPVDKSDNSYGSDEILEELEELSSSSNEKENVTGVEKVELKSCGAAGELIVGKVVGDVVLGDVVLADMVVGDEIVGDTVVSGAAVGDVIVDNVEVEELIDEEISVGADEEEAGKSIEKVIDEKVDIKVLSDADINVKESADNFATDKAVNKKGKKVVIAKILPDKSIAGKVVTAVISKTPVEKSTIGDVGTKSNKNKAAAVKKDAQKKSKEKDIQQTKPKKITSLEKITEHQDNGKPLVRKGGINTKSESSFETVETEMTESELLAALGGSLSSLSFHNDMRYSIPEKPYKNGTRHSMSFTNEKYRDIERVNRILLKKIMDKKRPIVPQRSLSASFARPLVPRTTGSARATTSAVNRRKQQQQIDMANAKLDKRIREAKSRQFT